MKLGKAYSFMTSRIEYDDKANMVNVIKELMRSIDYGRHRFILIDIEEGKALVDLSGSPFIPVISNYIIDGVRIKGYGFYSAVMEYSSINAFTGVKENIYDLMETSDLTDEEIYANVKKLSEYITEFTRRIHHLCNEV